jgi:hypothetical protein
VSSYGQKSESTSRGTATKPSDVEYLSFTPPWQTPNLITNAVVVKDGTKTILRIGSDDVVTRWLGQRVGSLVTVYIPSLGVAWTSTLARRRRWGYLYVRIPGRLRKLFEPIWLAGYPIPVIISIPPISMVQG